MDKTYSPSVLRLMVVLGLSLLFFGLPANPPLSAQDGTDSKLELRKPHTLNVLPPETATAFGIQSFLDFEADLKQLNQQFAPEFPWAEFMVMFLREYIDFWGIQEGWDETLPAAIFLLNRPPQDDQPPLMVALPISNMAAMTANFDLTPDTMPPGELIHTAQRKRGNQWFKSQSFCYAGITGQYLILGNDSDAMKTVLKGEALNDQLSPEERAVILDGDMFLYVHRENALKQDKEDRTLQTLIDWQPLLEFQDIDRLLMGMNLDKTIDVSCLLTTRGERARKLLTRQIEQHPAASLIGLPRGTLLAAYTLSETHREIELGLMNLISTVGDDDSVWGNLQPQLPRGLLNNLTDIMRVGWDQVAGFRSAVYQNEQAASDGQFCLVTILETADPEQFVADMTGLAPFVNLALKDRPPENDLPNPGVIDSLIEALGSRNFRSRQLATTKLSLIGVPALSQLQQANQSNDLEVRFRASKIIKQIEENQVEAARNKVQHRLLSELKPQLVYQANQEMRQGHAVDYIRLKISDEQADVKNQLRYLFGPDWYNIRLVTVNGKVLLVLGSNSNLIEQALAHLDEGTSGLTEMTRWSPQHSGEASEKVAQVLVSLSAINALLSKPSDGSAAPPNTLTSHTLSIKPNQIRLDIVAPYSEIKALSDLFFGNH